MPSQKQRELRAQRQREAEARRAEACHAEALKKEAVKAKEEAARQEAEARTTPQRTGGAFANDTPPAPLPPRPPQPASRHPALRRTNPRNVDTEELLRDARDEGEPTPEVVDDVRAPLALRRTLQPPSKPWVGADGRLMAVWECRQSGVFSAPIAVCSSCGYCRPASGLDEPFDNGSHLFARGLVANEQQVTMFDCRRCLRQGITSRPFAIGGAGRWTAQEIEVWQPPPIEPTEEQQLEMKKWKRLKDDWNDEDYQKGVAESKITAAEERVVRRDQNRTLLGAHGVRVLEACILDDTCKKRLAAFRRAAAAELPFAFAFQTEAVVSENTPLPNAVAVENVLRVFETEVVAILARAWNREGSGRLEAEKAAIELAEPLRTLRAELCAQRRGNKTDADALNDFRRAVREALREAQKFRKDWERTVGRKEHELLSGAVDASVAARWPVPHYRAAFSRDPLAHELRLVPTSLKLASEYKRATHRNLRHSDRWVNVPFGFKDVDVVERLVTDDGELAPIRCCGRVYCYVYDKGPKPVATFLAPLPDDSDPAFRSVPALIASLGDFEGVPDAKRGKYIGNSFSTTLPTSRLKRQEVEVAPDIYHDGHNFSDGCGLISPALARDAARRARHDESDGGGAMQVRFGGSKGMLVVDPRMGPTVRRMLLSPSMVKAPSGDLRLEVKEFASIKKEGNMLFLQVLVCLEHLLGDAAHLLHELLRVFIRKTLMWTPADVDGGGGGYSGDATGEQLARLSTALKALQVVDESLALEGDEEEDLVDLRLRGPLGVDGKPEEASVLKAIRAAVPFCVEIKLSQRVPTPSTRCTRLTG